MQTDANFDDVLQKERLTDVLLCTPNLHKLSPEQIVSGEE